MRQLKDLGLIIAYELHGFRYHVKYMRLLRNQKTIKEA